MQNTIPKIYFFYCSYKWKKGGQNQPSAIKYKGKHTPSKVRGMRRKRKIRSMGGKNDYLGRGSKK